MKRSERIALIKGVSKKLSELPYDDIDLILRQFNLPWSESWSGDRLSYVIHHIEDADNDVLMELYEYLHDGISFPGALSSAKKLPWMDNYFKLFISHSSKDKKLVSHVKIFLHRYGIDSFVAHEDIEPSKEWIKEIEVALDACDALAAFITGNFHSSFWTDHEVGYCIKRRVLIIPVHLGVDPYGFMSKYQALKKHGGNSDKIAKGIFNVLSTHDLTAFRMAPCIITVFEKSDSFATAKSNLSLLSKIKTWTPDMLQRIEQAVKKNNQIKGSWGVPEKVKEIINKHRK